MRADFHARLAALDDDLVGLGLQVQIAVRHAGRAVLEAHLGSAETVLSDAHDIAETAQRVGMCAASLIARQQPVAHDLRALVGAQRAAGDLGRMGQTAAAIARTARRRYPASVPAEGRGVVQDMSALAERVTQVTVNGVLSRHDLPAAMTLATLAASMQHLYQEMLVIVASPAWPHDVASAVSLSMISRDYMQLTEYAQAVAAAIGYIESGGHVKHA